MGVPWGQSGMWEVSWILLVRVQNGKLLRWHPMPHSIRIQWETVGALRWRIGSPWAERSLRFRAFFISAAPRSADDRGGKGPALLGSFEPLLWRWRQLRAVRLLLHRRDNCQRLRGRAGRCCCCSTVPLPKLLLLLHHFPDLLHLLLSLGDHFLLCHLLPLLNPFAPRTSGEKSKDSLVQPKFAKPSSTTAEE